MCCVLFCLRSQVLCRWVLSVKKNYRPVKYHNWRHALNVTQTMFAMMVSASLQCTKNQMKFSFLNKFSSFRQYFVRLQMMNRKRGKWKDLWLIWRYLVCLLHAYAMILIIEGQIIHFKRKPPAHWPFCTQLAPWNIIISINALWFWAPKGTTFSRFVLIFLQAIQASGIHLLLTCITGIVSRRLSTRYENCRRSNSIHRFSNIFW